MGEGLSEEEYCKKNPSTGGCEKYRNCRQAYNAKCESCKQGISEEEYCKKNPSTDFLEQCKVARSTTREMAVRAAARHSLQTASLAPRARALRGSARRRGTVMSQVARSTTGGAAGARTTGMTAASKGTGASEIGLADDLGS